MSLGRLLTSGKSLMGLHNGESRYEMRAKNQLPKFGSKKNPFTSRRAEALQSEFSRRLPESAAPQEPAPVAVPASAPQIKTQAVAEVPSRPAAEPQSRAAVKSALPGRLKRFLRALNPLRWRRERNKPAIPRFDKGPVQGELSLDQIRVVRNDLTETDVEVAPVKISVESKQQPSCGNARAPETPELLKS